MSTRKEQLESMRRTLRAQLAQAPHDPRLCYNLWRVNEELRNIEWSEYVERTLHQAQRGSAPNGFSPIFGVPVKKR